MLTITPVRALSDDSAACDRSRTERKLTCMTASNCSGVKSSSVARWLMAALLTRMSRPPHFSIVVVTRARVAFTSRRSPSTKNEPFPRFAASAFPFSTGMPVTATRAPSAASAVAIAAPSPMQLPVTRATFPSSCLVIAAAAEMLGELLAQELRALAQVVETDLDGRPFAVLDAHPAGMSGLRERAEDAVVVVEAFADHAVLHELRVPVLPVAGHLPQLLDRAAFQVAVGRLHRRHPRQDAVQELVGVLARDDRVGRIVLGL